MVSGVLQTVRRTIEEYALVKPGNRVVVGVSGGPDSLTLLHILWRLADDLGISLHVAHLNHMLRGEQAREDARFVADFSASLGLEATVEEVSVADLARISGLSVEMAGREARYAFFRRVCREVGAARLALGHHRDDQVETVLMRFLRGAGPSGLVGIRPVRDGWVIRPLLEVGREDIIAYCREEGLRPRFDHTNEERTHFRNRIRMDLLPYLEREFNPAIRSALVNLARVLRDEESWIEDLIEKIYPDVVEDGDGQAVIDVDKMRNLPVAVQRRLLRQAYRFVSTAMVSEVGLEFDHTESLRDLLQAPAGRTVALPGGIEARGEQGKIVLGPADEDKLVEPYLYEFSVPGSVFIHEAGVVIRAEIVEAEGAEALNDPSFLGDGRLRAVFDADKVVLPLKVRNRLPGDVFYPFGLGAAKKLKEYFIAEKVPRAVRSYVPLVISGDDIIWVTGFRPDERFSIDIKTKRCLVLNAEPRRDKGYEVLKWANGCR